jgi:hypothetical protein
MLVTPPAHVTLLELITVTILVTIIINFLYLSSSPVSCLLLPDTTLGTLFSNAFSISSYLKVRDQVSYSYETVGNISALQILIFKLEVYGKPDIIELADNKHSHNLICSYFLYE